MWDERVCGMRGGVGERVLLYSTVLCSNLLSNSSTFSCHELASLSTPVW